MIVREVRIENVKSYGTPAEVISLARGVNAISGENGAGKSTVLEAIGAALFQHLPYKSESFVREGESAGTITVLVESRLDGRAYEVVRRVGKGATHYVFDVELGLHLAKGESDVGRWLRQHLGVDSDVDLKAIFLDTVGPPQGTLTAAFLDTAQVRRAKFNRLLRVEEYEDAFRKLSTLESALEAENADLALAIKELEVQTRGRASIELRRAARRDEQAALALKLSRLIAEEEAIDRRLGQFEAASHRWNAARAALDLARERETNATRHVDRARDEVAAARQATETCRETRAARDSFRGVEGDLLLEEERGDARDRLRDGLSQITLRAERHCLDLERLDREIRLGEEAVRQIAELEAKVPAQEAAEARAAAARASVREIEDVRRRLNEIKDRGVRSADRVSRAEKAVASANAHQIVAEDLPARRQRHDELTAALAEVNRAEGELATLAKAAHDESRRHDLLEQRRQVLDEKHRVAEGRARYATKLEELEARFQEANGKRATAQSRLAHAVETRSKVSGGVCPFLLEPCQNLREGVTLDAYFDDETDRWRRELARLDLDFSVADRDLQAARAQERERISAEQLRRESESVETELKASRGRLDEICQRRDAAASVTAKRATISHEEQVAATALREAERAAQEVARLPELQREVDDARLELDRFRKEWQATSRRVAEAGDVEAELRTALAEVDAIGRPRELVARFRADASRLPEARTERDGVATQLAAIHDERASVERDLVAYADVDRRIADLRASRDRLRPLYEQYVAALPLAESLETRIAAFVAVEHALAEYADATRLARIECDRASEAYDRDDHLACQKRRAELGGEIGEARAQIEVANQDEQRLDDELAEIAVLEQRLEGARSRAAELVDEKDRAVAIRQVIRATGPEMTRRLLGSISRLATSINADILSHSGIEVEWTADYEILTRREGETRGYAQLSGGEQMSAALAVRMAAMRLLSNVRVAFLDEPTAHLDSSRRANLGDQVQRLQGFDQLVVISHDDTFDGLFGHVVRVEKRDGRSRVVDVT